MRILNFQRMSTEDGPGLRTTLFLKGCSLSCKWCHNPESIAMKKQTEWMAVRCIGCGVCALLCTQKAVSLQADGVSIDRDLCIACGACAEKCPGDALEVKGKDMEVSDIFTELLKDKAFFGSEGGVTLSGGEALLQAEEARQLLCMLKDAGVGTAVDTCGLVSQKAIEEVLPFTDYFLYDIKLFDGEEHEKKTGANNRQILENFDFLTEAIKGSKTKIWIRTPIIPHTTDTEENIRAIARFLRNRYERWELCAFNNLCLDKYERLYQNWDYANEPLITVAHMEQLVNAAKEEGAVHVYATGATREER